MNHKYAVEEHYKSNNEQNYTENDLIIVKSLPYTLHREDRTSIRRLPHYTQHIIIRQLNLDIF